MSFKNWGNMQASLEALYALDSAFLEPDEEYLRLISKKEDENSLRYVVDNGQGDLLDVIFTREAAKFRSYFLPDEIEQTTFFIWYDGTEHQNLVGSNSGGRWLLSYAFDDFAKFSEFVKGYYEIDFDDEMLKKLYEKGELEKERLKEIR